MFVLIKTETYVCQLLNNEELSHAGVINISREGRGREGDIEVSIDMGMAF